MNLKYFGCKIEGCTAQHKGKGYCQKHLEKHKRGTLEVYPHSKLCEIEGCFSKSYCHNKCIKHYQRDKKGLPVDLPYSSKDEYQRGNFDFEHKSKDSWSIAVRRFFNNKCMICGWEETSCEAHHIIPKAKKGKNILQNAVILCPNHHTLAHSGKLTQEYLQEINKKAIELKTTVEPLKDQQ